ncbi:MAG: MmgE/PrpD family protein [Polaromonas sp.]|nr:MmgE/PrpD family protein [Polaromonas sp.]
MQASETLLPSARAAGEIPLAAELIAAYVSSCAGDQLPGAVLHEAARCFLNFTGCALAGGSHDVVGAVDRAISPLSGPGAASVIGHGKSTSPLLAALLNGASASAHSFDDTHAEAVVHPGAPVCAAALAAAQMASASGPRLLQGIALGAEITCRLSKAISVAPAENDIGWYQTSVTGGIGAAIAVGKILGLDAHQMANAMGIAVAMASGSRIMQGSMTMLMLAGHAARCGLEAALMAREGFQSPTASLDGAYGFTDVFSKRAHPQALTGRLGSHFEILANTYKAYPCGVVLHPVVDACLELRGRHEFVLADVNKVFIRMSPVALMLTDRRHPATRTEGQVSVHHWAATALVLGRATLEEGLVHALQDPATASFRDKVFPCSDPTLARDEVSVSVECQSGQVLHSARFRGCRPMSDLDLAHKFRAQFLHGGASPDVGRMESLLAEIQALPDRADLERLGALL